MSAVGRSSNVCFRKSANSSREASAARSVTSSVISLAVPTIIFMVDQRGLREKVRIAPKPVVQFAHWGDLSTGPRVPGAGSYKNSYAAASQYLPAGGLPDVGP